VNAFILSKQMDYWNGKSGWDFGVFGDTGSRWIKPELNPATALSNDACCVCFALLKEMEILARCHGPVIVAHRRSGVRGGFSAS
jgi:hypothetical protein